MVAFIPLRGGSKSIPLKNIREIAGHPLAYWTVKAAAECPEISMVFVATDDDQIRTVVEGFGFNKVSVIGRHAETATDFATTESALLQFAEEHNFESVALIQATSPLLKSAELTSAFHKMSREGYDSMVSVARQKRFLWEELADGAARPLNYHPKNRPRRQEFDGHLVENGAFYLIRRSALLDSKCRLSGRIGIFEMPAESYLEIDELPDWKAVESLLVSQKTKKLNSTDLSKTRMFVTDVDGVLTDAGMYYSENGDELKKFNTRDAVGLRLLREAGITVGIITSEKTRLMEKRATKMGVDFLHQGVANKLEILKEECSRRKIPLHQVAYIGDDINDLECMYSEVFSACPTDAVIEIKKNVSLVLNFKGGAGAVRQFADLILNSTSPVS